MDRGVYRTLAAVAYGHDEANDHERVVLEHEALCGVLAQVRAVVAGAGGAEASPGPPWTVVLTGQEADEVRYACVQRIAAQCDAALTELRGWLADPKPAPSHLPLVDAAWKVEEAAALIRVVERKLVGRSEGSE